MGRKHRENYEPGDQVHFVLTEDFVDTYSEFIKYCEENSINVSGAIRSAVEEWLEEKKEEKEEINRIKHRKNYSTRNDR